MITRNLMGLGLAALALAGCGSKTDTTTATTNTTTTASTTITAMTPPAGTSWVDTVAKSPEGGFVMGNPNAPVKLIEYGSLTCPHCAAFEQEGLPELKSKFVATGKVSYEFRNYVRDVIDVTAAALTRCRGPEPYFQLTEQVFTNQASMFEKAQAIPKADSARIASLPQAQQFSAFAKLIGLDQFFKVRGLPVAQADACLADQKAIDELTKMNETANKQYNLQGTPTFVLNGKVVPDAAAWEALKPALTAAVGG